MVVLVRVVAEVEDNIMAEGLMNNQPKMDMMQKPENPTQGQTANYTDMDDFDFVQEFSKLDFDMDKLDESGKARLKKILNAQQAQPVQPVQPAKDMTAYGQMYAQGADMSQPQGLPGLSGLMGMATQGIQRVPYNKGLMG